MVRKNIVETTIYKGVSKPTWEGIFCGLHKLSWKFCNTLLFTFAQPGDADAGNNRTFWCLYNVRRSINISVSVHGYQSLSEKSQMPQDMWRKRYDTQRLAARIHFLDRL